MGNDHFPRYRCGCRRCGSNRLTFSVDVYDNTTRNLLVNVPVPTTSGYTSQIQNVGSTRNKGLEVQAAATIMQQHAFRWTGSFNISFNQNKIISLGDQQTNYLANSRLGRDGQSGGFYRTEGAAGRRDVWVCQRWVLFDERFQL